MVETIAPVVHGGRNATYYLAVAAHIVGATLAAAALGLLLGTAGAALGAPWGTLGIALVVVVAGIYAARELFGLKVPLPDLDRQVPDWWRTFFSAPVAALLYGIGLGVGFFTYLSYGTLAPVAVAALATGDPAIGIAILAPFGAARGLSVLIAAPTKRDPEEIVDALGRTRWRRLGRAVNGTMLAAVLTVTALALI